MVAKKKIHWRRWIEDEETLILGELPAVSSGVHVISASATGLVHHMTAPRKAAVDVELQLLEFFSLIALHLYPPSHTLSLLLLFQDGFASRPGHW